MAEVTAREQTGELSTERSLAIVQDYLQVLRGIDLREYERVDGVTDDVFLNKTPDSSSGEDLTFQTRTCLERFYARPTAETFSRFNLIRQVAAVHVVRYMIQGGKFPVGQFREVISSTLDTLAAISGTPEPTKRHRQRIKDEIDDVWGFAVQKPREAVIMRRAAEAYKFVGGPRAYGRRLGKVALAESIGDAE